MPAQEYCNSSRDHPIRVHFNVEKVQSADHFVNIHLYGYGYRDAEIQCQLIVNGNTVGERTLPLPTKPTTLSVLFRDVNLCATDEVTFWMKQTTPVGIASIAQVALVTVPTNFQRPFWPEIENSPIREFGCRVASPSPVEIDLGGITVEWQSEGIEVEIYRMHAGVSIHVGTTSENSFRDSIGGEGLYEYFLVVPGLGIHPETASINITKAYQQVTHANNSVLNQPTPSLQAPQDI